MSRWLGRSGYLSLTCRGRAGFTARGTGRAWRRGAERRGAGGAALRGTARGRRGSRRSMRRRWPSCRRGRVEVSSSAHLRCLLQAVVLRPDLPNIPDSSATTQTFSRSPGERQVAATRVYEAGGMAWHGMACRSQSQTPRDGVPGRWAGRPAPLDACVVSETPSRAVRAQLWRRAECSRQECTSHDEQLTLGWHGGRVSGVSPRDTLLLSKDRGWSALALRPHVPVR